MSANHAFGQCEIRTGERQLLIRGEPAALGARAFDLLLALVERRDRVVEKSELLDAVWPGLVVEENNLQVQVSSLRKLLGASAIVTIPGRGYRFTAELRSGPAEARADARQAAPPPTNLRLPRSRFVGREAALAQCASLLQEARLLTLSGIGGCGKTRLAQELARRELGAHPDGVWWVDLASQQEASGVVASIAAAVGIQESGEATLARLTERLQAQRMLVVLDNCEHVIDAVAEAIEAMLAEGTALSLIATSREALGLPGEQVFAVRSLSLPVSGDVAAIRESEAVRLFIDRARLVVPDFDLDAGNAAAMAEICRRLDGIPLAIELAASRIRVLSIEDIRARLDDRFRLLTGGSRALPRHQTLQATMQWSHDLLTVPEQRLFRRLAVFAGGCTLAAAAQVAGDSDDEYAALETLTALHDKSLVIVDRDAGARPRYRMLETVRQYAEERLTEAGEGAEVRTRQLQHFVTLGGQLEIDLAGPGAAAAIATMKPDAENLVAALAWAAHAPGGGDLAMRLVTSAWRYWRAMNEPDRGYRLARAAIGLVADAPDTRHHFGTLLALSKFALATGRYDELLECSERALGVAGRLADAGLMVHALELTAHGYLLTGNKDQGLARLLESCDLARARSDWPALAVGLHNLAELRRADGDLADAEALYGEALAVRRELDAPAQARTTLACLAMLFVATQRPAEARAALVECVEIQEARGDLQDVDLVGAVAATLAAALEEHAVAARFHGAVVAFMQAARSRHEPVDEAFIEPRIAAARTAMGDTAFAAAESAGMALGSDALMAELAAWLRAPTPTPAAAGPAT